MKLRKLQAGLYATHDGRYRIERDGYEQIRDDEQHAAIERGDRRYRGSSSRGGYSPYRAAPEARQHYAPEVPVWIVFEGDSDDHHGNMFDTLREARAYVAAQYARAT